MALILSGTNGITDVNGSAAAPAITGTDTDTGVFFGTNTVSLSTGGTERLQVDSSGNAGLGVTPSAWSLGKAIEVGNLGSAIWSYGPTFFTTNYYYNSVDKFAGTGYALTYVQSKSSGAHSWNISTASGSAGGTATMTQAMTLDASGRLGVNETSPSSQIHINGNSNSLFTAGLRVNRYQTAGQYGTINYSNGTFNIVATDTALTSPSISFSTSTDGSTPTERARIDSSGNFLFGKTSYSANNVGFQVANTATADGAIFSSLAATTNSSATNHVYSTGASAYRFYVGMAGTVYAVNTTISAISDQRLKENIRDLDEGLNVVMALKPRRFDWKEGKGKDIKNDRGWIAQEFEQVLPDMIDEWKDPAPEGEEPYKSVNANLIPVLVKAIQEQQAIITQLQADVAALKGNA